MSDFLLFDNNFFVLIQYIELIKYKKKLKINKSNFYIRSDFFYLYITKKLKQGFVHIYNLEDRSRGSLDLIVHSRVHTG